MPEAASMQTVTAPSTIHAGCTRRIELTCLRYGLRAGRFAGRGFADAASRIQRKGAAEPGAWNRQTPGSAIDQRRLLAGRRGGHLRSEDDGVALGVDRDGVAVVQLALQQLERQRVLDEALDGPLERPRPERRIVALASEQAPGRVGHLELDAPSRQPLAEMAELDVHDPGDLVPTERREDHDLVDPVEELGPERAAQLLHQQRPHLLGLLVLAEDVASEVRRDRKSTRLNSSHLGISYA